ncbi:MAG: flavin reductase family protein [Fretibacterium sp.]|nr:flavin reductase family protein [Fretibacterium sp.]
MKKNIGPKTVGFPTPVVLVGTTDGEGRPNLVTLAWVGICCSEPPAVQVSLRPSRYSHAAIVDRGAFSVCVPSKRYMDQTDFCGIASGRSCDKFAAAGLTVESGPELGLPLVAEFPVCLECRLLHTFTVGSHDLFVGEIVSCSAEESVLDARGRLEPDALEALVYMPGDGYYDLGPRLGSSFEVGKRLMPHE